MKHTLLITLCLCTAFVYGQKIKKFTADPDIYITELNTFLDKADKKEGLLLANEFATYWPRLNEEQKKSTYQISNNFLKKRLVAYNDFKSFLKATMFFINQDKPQHVSDWLASLATRSKKYPQKKTRTFINNVYHFIDSQKLYESKKLTWLFSGGSYSFEFGDEPQFILKNTDLKCRQKQDSSIITNTSGIFYPISETFKGQGGRVYWSRAGYHTDSVYAELNQYSIRTNKPHYQADSVVLHSLYYIQKPLMGRLEERLGTVKTPEKAVFPRFESYDESLSINNLVEGVDFNGGFAIIGRRFYGGGLDTALASLRFKHEGKMMIKVYSRRFLLDPTQINAENVAATVYLDTDSIYHPKLKLRFLTGQRLLYLTRENDGLSKTAFANTFHNVDMYFQVLSWDMDQPKLNLGNLNVGGASSVVFESRHYFRGEKFEALQGLSNINPLYLLRRISQAYGSRDFSIARIAEDLRMSEHQARVFLMNMSIEGFVNYNGNKGQVSLQQKLFDYLNYNEAKKDYDVIRFRSSLARGSNAVISLLNYDMEIRGLNNIALSDSQQVLLSPSNNKISMKKGIDFEFDGQVMAGRFRFSGTKFIFDYEQFKIHMTSIDSMRFKVKSFKPDKYGKHKLVNVKTALQDISGELLIDQPNNKSGRKRFSEYPLFRCSKDAYVYYDKPSIHKGAYIRDRFYIRLDPFEIDSLDNTTTEGLQFTGTFTSARIFPDIDVDVKVQEDYSLGFITETPKLGYPAYSGRGRFTNILHMSNQGLIGNGDLKHLTSTSRSDALLFFPDSMRGPAHTFDIAPQEGPVPYPPVIGENANLYWLPYRDTMHFYHPKSEPWTMFGTVGLQNYGNLILEPIGLSGDGKLEFEQAETHSERYAFKSKHFTADTLDFKVRVEPGADWAFQLSSARAHIDFKNRKGTFDLNKTAGFMEFPITQYHCFMDHAEWMMDEKTVEIKKKSEAPSSLMVSVHPQQDSLQFVAGSAKFSLLDNYLEAFQAKEIDVADARIFPDSAYVMIEEKAHMRRLEKARMRLSKTNNYHQLYNASVQISSRNKYVGEADYDYKDEDKTIQVIHFSEVGVDSTGRSYGKGTISAESEFFLSPFFAYYGGVRLSSSRQLLTFRGRTLIQHVCKHITTDWIAFEAEIDPMDVFIDLPPPHPVTGIPFLRNGIYMSRDSSKAYSAFLSKQTKTRDPELVQAGGQLYYDKDLFSYVIAPKEKIAGETDKGNELLLNNKDCVVKGTGKMSLGNKLGQMDFKAYGSTRHDMELEEVEADVAVAIDFHFAKEVLEQMALAINSKDHLQGTDISSPPYSTAVNELLGDKQKEKYLERISLYGAPEKMPKALDKTLLISKIQLYWNEETNSFVSEGPIGIAGISEFPVNKLLEGKIELIRRGKGDELYIYLEADNDTWYYFQYRRNLLQFISSDDALVTIIKEMNPDRRRKEGKDGAPPFGFSIATKGKRNRFLSRFEE